MQWQTMGKGGREKVDQGERHVTIGKSTNHVLNFV